MLLLGQFVAQTPVLSMYDLTMGLICTALLIEYTRESKKIAPEALGFLSGVLRLFAGTSSAARIPSLKDSKLQEELRKAIFDYTGERIPLLSFEKSNMQEITMPNAILHAALNLVGKCIEVIDGSISGAEQELFFEILNSLLSFELSSLKQPFPKRIDNKIIKLSSGLLQLSSFSRKPLIQRDVPRTKHSVLKQLAPRLEDPLCHTISKDEGKATIQSYHDRTRREFKREHKAIARELRLDAAFVEVERRRDDAVRVGAARAKRQKNFNWMEGEQATMNQQVRLGGGLLSGGGTGAARAKVKSAKMGIKKGGKF